MTVFMDDRAESGLEEGLFCHVVEVALAYEGYTKQVEVSLSLVDDAEIREMNKRFRDIDRPTDVLSFPLLTFKAGEVAETNGAGEILLGDIVISVERAKAQAEEYGHSLKRELAFLTAHSMLHLLGYDHMSPEEEKDMFAKQEAILQQAGIPRQ